MKLEDQVVNLELSKRLEQLGVKQESYFEWVLRGGNWQLWDKTMHSDYETGVEKEFISAYTIAELGEMLPKGYYTCDGEDWICSEGNHKHFTFADTEANARAKMVIYLKEKK